MAGTMRPNEMNVSTTPVMSSKSLPGISDLKSESAKKPSAPRAPRIDVEPLYSAVKSAVSDADWKKYKTSLAAFLMGNLNQEELGWRLDKILTTPALDHAHNTLMLAIYANTWRDSPEAGIASWVSSSDKPSSGLVKGSGDETEKRLKGEVMHLSRRERKRLKTIHQAGDSGAPSSLVAEGVSMGNMGPIQELIDTRRVKLPETGPSTAGAQGGYQKTNWDLEIRKRYTSSLFTETHEFPTATTISHRLLPICYEFGLPQGHTNDCPEFLNLATETYIKEALTNFFQLVSSNGPGFVRTANFKKRVAKEERMVERGELAKVQGAASNVVGGELPVEQEERRKRKLLCMEDLRLALELGDSYLGQVPLIAGNIVNNRFLDSQGMEDIYPSDAYVHDVPWSQHAKNLPANGVNTNGANGTDGVKNATNGMTNGGGMNGLSLDIGDPMDLDDDFTFQWQGGSVQEIQDLDLALDDVLNLGDI